ncbi:hypothetical protein CAOG_02646 [Capsaspora owczarzaki ATCC 30864]|uniref:Telomere length regulation protein conserved domain-containing protein n=1 Tax=Capsaspora owczarzaki (strain ATCC 30864) TaxID=595528 RepID=A0A0D2WMR9_CAPO3|nr:hypothetical protein CAOG_02646 [Capsaspora owczarzaki ATCC 30864]KJE91518.1 hypothetical protein CAOG_002646 [Capsaspora owczarzaki ATCC 30864]|eukprot:XP_004349396.1 hypothetical protein CAOG_02646 [Capsaspora owczarzaki ATCC 30864]
MSRAAQLDELEALLQDEQTGRAASSSPLLLDIHSSNPEAVAEADADGGGVAAAMTDCLARWMSRPESSQPGSATALARLLLCSGSPRRVRRLLTHLGRQHAQVAAGSTLQALAARLQCVPLPDLLLLLVDSLGRSSVEASHSESIGFALALLDDTVRSRITASALALAFTVVDAPAPSPSPSVASTQQLNANRHLLTLIVSLPDRVANAVRGRVELPQILASTDAYINHLLEAVILPVVTAAGLQTLRASVEKLALQKPAFQDWLAQLRRPDAFVPTLSTINLVVELFSRLGKLGHFRRLCPRVAPVFTLFFSIALQQSAATSTEFAQLQTLTARFFRPVDDALVSACVYAWLLCADETVLPGVKALPCLSALLASQLSNCWTLPNATILDASLHYIIVERCLMGHQPLSVPALTVLLDAVACVKSQPLLPLTRRLLTYWGMPATVKRSAYDQHLQLSQVLLLCLARLSDAIVKPLASEILASLVGSVQTHLESPLIRVRQLGMITAECFAARLASTDKPLSFQQADDELSILLRSLAQPVASKDVVAKLPEPDALQFSEISSHLAPTLPTSYIASSFRLFVPSSAVAALPTVAAAAAAAATTATPTPLHSAQKRMITVLSSTPNPNTSSDPSLAAATPTLDDADSANDLDDDEFVPYALVDPADRVERVDTANPRQTPSVPIADRPQPRAAVKPPKFLRDCAQGLIARDDVPRVEASLQAVESLLTTSPMEQDDVSVEICKMLLYLHNEHSIAKFEELRMRGMVAACVRAPADVARYLSAQFYVRNHTLSQRTDIVDVLCSAAKALAMGKMAVTPLSRESLTAQLKTAQAQTKRGFGRDALQQPQITSVSQDSLNSQSFVAAGKVVRASTASLNARTAGKVVWRNRLQNVAGWFFYPLLEKFDSDTGGNLFGLLGNEGVFVLGRLCHGLGVIMHCASNCTDAPPMARALMAFVWALRGTEHAYVRRALVFCVNMVLLAVPASILVADLGTDLYETQNWLADIMQRDSDDESRDLAVSALSALLEVLKSAPGMEVGDDS